jgi:hypothetical protein
MLAVYFCHFYYSQVESICALIKVDWLAACIAPKVQLTLYWSFSSSVGVKFAQSSEWEARANT